MSSAKMLRLTLLGLAVIIGAVGVLFALRLTRGSGSEIVLPTPVPSAITDTEVILNNIDVLTVSADNIRDVVARLDRPNAYSRDIIIESFWDGGESVYNFNVSVRDGVTALRTFFGGTSKYIVITGEYRYIWYAGDSEPVKVKNTSVAADDKNQMIVTYEDIVGLERSQILSAELIIDENDPVIFVRYMSSPFGYVTEVYVSIELGLITSVEQYDGDTLIYRMSTGVCNLETPGDTGFILPNGVNTLE